MSTTKKTTTTTKKKKPVPLPVPPLAPRAVEGAVELLVLSAPPAGRSGEVRVRKALHDALGADPRRVGPHVSRVSAMIAQDTEGKRWVALRLVLDEDFPNLPLETLPERLQLLMKAGAARCAEIMGADFHVIVDFGGKKLR